uniref:Bifunctional polynucleotide phosphatase/kinase n=2 Tax=Melanaphis sacchari TaxID=742174 RepID=A0A2H8TJF9_9HEMI
MSELKTNDGVKYFVLVSDENPEQKFILLHNEPFILGKKQQIGMVNHKLSKSQMKFVADYSTGKICVQQLGKSRSAINNQSMSKGEKRLLNHGDKVALLYKSNHTYHFDFLTLSYNIDYNKNNFFCINKAITPKILLSNSTSMWDIIDGTLLVFNSTNIVHKDKIAAFDMDGILNVALSGKDFPDDENDWKIYNSNVKRSIKSLSDNGYKLVIFTNQRDIVGNKENEKKFKTKIENIPKLIKTPVQVFIATRKDIYGKPAPGMWNILLSDFNGGISVDTDKSFFCGVAAGRRARFNSDGKRVKKDQSCYDRLFAMNIGLKFYTPEEYFWKEPTSEAFALPSFNPNDVLSNIFYTNLSSQVLFSSHKEMIIMVGCPGSGKSYFAANSLLCHDRMKIINRDTLGSWQKCIAKTTKYLCSSSVSVVIDNTNPDVETRKQFIDIAKIFKIPCRVFLMKVSKQHGKHNNKFRELTDKQHPKVSEEAIDLYFSKFQKPSKKEGISEIVPINFVPHFKNPYHEKLYKMFLL